MKLDDLKRAYPPLSADRRDAIVRAAHTVEEEQPVKKRMSMGLALAIALTLLMAGTAVALVMGRSVREYLPPKFADRVIDIHDEYENQWFRVRINDAIFDGVRMTFALNMEGKADRADEVFVWPVISAATASGKQLKVDFESGYEFFDGVWMPERSILYPGFEAGEYTVDALLVDDDYEPRANTGEEITWRLDFHVLKPNWPVAEHKEPFDSDKMSHQDYMAQFEKAYADRQILLTYGDTVVEWISVLPAPQGITKEEFLVLPQWEQLVRSGTFDEVEHFARTFSTTAQDSLKQAEPETYALDGMTLHLRNAQASYMALWVELEVEAKGLTSPVPYDALRLEARAQGKVLQMISFAGSGKAADSGLLRLRGEYGLAGVEGVPDTVTLVPVWVRYPDASKGETQSTDFVEEGRAFEVKLK
ncbi:MAG: hypothetical protein GX653_08420 [Clostridiales bacterium]|nr:hypothetical protein [Clostridiales bacterium]